MDYLEKRRSPRVATHNFISYYLLDESKKLYREVFAKAKDISDYGLLMVTGSKVESDYVLVKAIDDKNNIIEMKGKVCHSVKDETGVIYTGIEFVADDEKRLQFAKCLKKAQQMIQDLSILSDRF